MVRRRRSQVSQSEKRRWLENMEGGKGITEIARAAGRDIRVVKRHVEIAREERDLARARHDFIRSRLELHQEDLLGQVHRMRDIVVGRRAETLTAANYPHDKLHRAFIEHIEHLTFGNLLAAWEDGVAQYGAGYEAIRAMVESEETKLKSSLAKGISVYPWSEDVMAEEETGLWNVAASTWTYTRERVAVSDDVYILRGARRLLPFPIDEALASDIESAHECLRSVAQDLFSSLSHSTQQLKTLGTQIVDELDIFLFKRFVVGRCRYCPA